MKLVEHEVTVSPPLSEEDLRAIDSASVVRGRSWILFVLEKDGSVNVHTTAAPNVVVDVVHAFAAATLPLEVFRRQHGPKEGA